MQIFHKERDCSKIVGWILIHFQPLHAVSQLLELGDVNQIKCRILVEVVLCLFNEFQFFEMQFDERYHWRFSCHKCLVVLQQLASLIPYRDKLVWVLKHMARFTIQFLLTTLNHFWLQWERIRSYLPTVWKSTAWFKLLQTVQNKSHRIEIIYLSQVLLGVSYQQEGRWMNGRREVPLLCEWITEGVVVALRNLQHSRSPMPPN